MSDAEYQGSGQFDRGWRETNPEQSPLDRLKASMSNTVGQAQPLAMRMAALLAVGVLVFNAGMDHVKPVDAAPTPVAAVAMAAKSSAAPEIPTHLTAAAINKVVQKEARSEEGWPLAQLAGKIASLGQSGQIDPVYGQAKVMQETPNGEIQYKLSGGVHDGATLWTKNGVAQDFLGLPALKLTSGEQIRFDHGHVKPMPESGIIGYAYREGSASSFEKVFKLGEDGEIARFDFPTKEDGVRARQEFVKEVRSMMEAQRAPQPSAPRFR